MGFGRCSISDQGLLVVLLSTKDSRRVVQAQDKVELSCFMPGRHSYLHFSILSQPPTRTYHKSTQNALLPTTIPALHSLTASKVVSLRALDLSVPRNMSHDKNNTIFLYVLSQAGPPDTACKADMPTLPTQHLAEVRGCRGSYYIQASPC